MHEGLDMLGADDDAGGGLFSSIFKAVGTAAEGGIKYAQAEKAKGEASADAQKKLQAVISADQAATIAVAQALMSADLAKDQKSRATAEADKMVADSAVAAQDRAGAAIPDSVKQDRVDAAQKALDAAQTDLQKVMRSGSDSQQAIAKFKVKAAQQTLVKAQGGDAIMPSKRKDMKMETSTPSEGGNALGFLTKKVGPVPMWGILTAGALGVWYFLIRKR